MKLRNKKTGYITELDLNIRMSGFPNSVEFRKIKSLAELNEGWEDAPEEPKGCWIINIFGVVEYTHFRNEVEAELLKEIGNYFETEEEAEKVAEKRKAWTRLEAKGFKFTGWSINPGAPGGYRITAFDQWTHETKDFDLLFGDEE